MGKKKDREHGSPSRKKMKKHKKQKKQKRRESIVSDGDVDVANNEYDIINERDVSNDTAESSQDEGKGLKLKIKFGGKTLKEVVTTVHDKDIIRHDDTNGFVGNSLDSEYEVDDEEDEVIKDEEDEVIKDEEEDEVIKDEEDDEVIKDEDDDEVIKDEEDDEVVKDDDSMVLLEDPTRRDNNNDEQKSEEEQWLEALEKGELDDSGAIKKEKDISVMTARQRALHGETIQGENELLQLPMYPEKNEAETEEFERKRKLRAKKRKQQMEKQHEETRAQTIEKLLTKGKKEAKKDSGKASKKSGPYFTYINNQEGITIACPDDLDFPLQAKVCKEVPKPVLCAVEGCTNTKKYCCSRTKLPVCGLECYKILEKTVQCKEETIAEQEISAI